MLRPLLVAGLALTAALAQPATAATITPALSADYGAGWLGREIAENDDHIAALSGPDYNSTALAVLALVAAEVGEEQAAAATEFLFDNVDAYVVDGGGDDRPAALATLILVGHARGIDTSALLTRLQATQRTTGEDAGLFGVQDATYDGAYRQGLALLAIASAGGTDEEAIAWLADEKCPDGGWMGNNPDPDAASCPAFDFNTFVGVDTNGTAMAAMGLYAAGGVDYPVVQWLKSVRNADGGWGFAEGMPSDGNSTALVAMALTRYADVVDETTKTYLMSLQLPNPPASTAGAFAFQAGGTANVFATVQVVPALAGKIVPFGPATLTSSLPLLPAPAVPATPSATPAVPVPSAEPTRLVDPAPVPELPATGLGEKPWDANGLVVTGLGLIGYGVLALGGARLVARRRS